MIIALEKKKAEEGARFRQIAPKSGKRTPHLEDDICGRRQGRTQTVKALEAQGRAAGAGWRAQRQQEGPCGRHGG